MQRKRVQSPLQVHPELSKKLIVHGQNVIKTQQFLFRLSTDQSCNVSLPPSNRFISARKPPLIAIGLPR
ncbi:hypothetical protein MTP99_012462 [Tenebrio molitor]|nr:hypothetical protein MTP99_012462 [Tenebrio molitor]